MNQSWANPDITLYHGTIRSSAERMLGTGIQLNFGRFGTDFGQGFYCTTVRRQAERWARRVSRERRNRFPVLLELNLRREDVARLDTLSFVNGHRDAAQLWSLIQHCRARGQGHGRLLASANGNGFYDVVFGPVAANWNSRKSFLFCDQVSFHTTRSENLLNGSEKRRMIHL